MKGNKVLFINFDKYVAKFLNQLGIILKNQHEIILKLLLYSRESHLSIFLVGINH
jgi:hypothetical protein